MSDGIDRSGMARNLWKDMIDAELKALEDDHAAGNAWGIRMRIESAQRVIHGYLVPRYANRQDTVPCGTFLMKSPCPNLMALVVERGWELLGTVDTTRYVPDALQRPLDDEGNPQPLPGYVDFSGTPDEAWDAQRELAKRDGIRVGI